MQTSLNFPRSAVDCSFLAIDTAFDICSVALLTPDISDCRQSDRLRKHADDVLPMIDSLLSTHNLELPSLDFLAMVSGPGSFTGLRIGTAVVQGLAFGADLPVVCVSSLAMMARSARLQTRTDTVILSCLHAREEEFYFAAYRDDLDHSPVPLIADTIFSPQQIRQSISDFLPDTESADTARIVFAGPGWQHDSLAELVDSPFSQSITVVMDALLLADIAAQDFRAGRALDASDATPAYLKDDMEYRTV